MLLLLAIHHPRPEHRDDLVDAMRDFQPALRGCEGLLDVRVWTEAADDPRIVALSTWESTEALTAAMPTMAAALAEVPFDEWERRPRELMTLTPVDELSGT